MKRLLMTLVAAAMLTACGAAGPKEVYYGMATAAEFGDLEGFLAGFTKESKQIIKAQLSLSEAYGLPNENPLTMLVFPAVDSVEETPDGKAILTLSKGSIRKRIIMSKSDEDGWKIDAKELADFWASEKRK